MEYVMVPVPEEHFEEFGQWLMVETLRAKLDSWSDASVADAVDQADAVLRRALRSLATKSTLWVEVGSLADEVGLSADELLADLAKLNAYCYGRSWPALVMVRDDAGGRHSVMMSGKVRPKVVALLPADPADHQTSGT